MASIAEAGEFEASPLSEWTLEERFELGECLYCGTWLEVDELRVGAVLCTSCRPPEQANHA